MTLPSMYIFETAKLVKSNMSLFKPNVNFNRRAESQVNLIMPAPRLKLYRKNCYFMACLIYNSIPKQITDMDYNSF